MMYRYLLAALLGLMLVACGGNDDSHGVTNETMLEHAQQHADPSYVCPMHSGVVSDQPGDCPICGMDLVEQDTDESAEHASEPMSSAMEGSAIEHGQKHADPSYVCPMHPGVLSDQPGDCPICGMDLVEQDTDEHAEHATEPMSSAMEGSAIEHGQKHADPSYVCPMHPGVLSDQPGDCPICGMDLVEQEALTARGQNAPVVRVSGAMQQNLAMRSAEVKRERLWRRIDTYGEVGFDETARHMVHVRAPGWIEAIDVRSEGETVAAGDRLFSIYSPELLAAQEEYRLALRRHGASHPQSEAAEDRLRQLAVPDALLATLRNGGEVQRLVPVYAPRSGVVDAINIRHGHYLTPDQIAYELVSLEQVWLEASVAQGQAEWLDQARWVEARVPGLSGRVWESEVDYLYPQLDPVSRSLRVRVQLDNSDGRLRPGMLADVVVFGGAKDNVLTVPAAAVIRDGGQSRVVRVLEDGRYQAVPIETGIQVNDRFEILSGLSEGQRVVERGQFLLDSESSLRSGLPAADHSQH
jgi:Cu(I)/Ag(I) efflux system membrane fusion protein